MNILFVSRCLPYPLHHGDRLILHHLSAQLRTLGHACDAVALTQRDENEADVPRSAALFGDLETVRERPRSALDYVRRLARPFPEAADRCWNPALWAAVARRLAVRRYDVVHVFGGVQVYEVRNLVRHAPSIIVPYESHSLWLERALASATRARDRLRLRAELAMARRYERTIYTGFDRVVMLSERDRRTVAELAPGLHVVVIPNGVHVPSQADRRKTRHTATLVFVGNYAYAPNVSAARVLVSEILPRVLAHVPEVRVTLVGANPARDVLALAGPDVDVTGWVPDLGPHLAQAACFVAPLRQGAGMKNKILEAMAAGVPVVATPLACDGIAVTPGRDVLIGQDTEELVACVVTLMRDAELAARLGQAGLALVQQRYTWPLVASRYEGLYREVVAERGASGP